MVPKVDYLKMVYAVTIESLLITSNFAIHLIFSEKCESDRFLNLVVNIMFRFWGPLNILKLGLSLLSLIFIIKVKINLNFSNENKIKLK